MSDNKRQIEDLEYSDPELEAQLKNLKEKTIEELAALQKLVCKQYTEANKEFQAKRITINAAKRRYYFRILIELFLEFKRFIKGQEPRAKRSKLKEEKLALRAWYKEQQDIFNIQKSIIKSSLDTLEEHYTEIDAKEQDLIALQEVITSIDQKIQQLDLDEQKELEDAMALGAHIDDRDELSDYLNGLYQKVERILNSLADIFGESLHSTDFAEQQASHKMMIAELKQQCEKIKDPLIEKLLVFLERKTDVSLEALQKAMEADESYHDNKQVADLIWAAAAFYPAISSGLSREEVLASRIEAKEAELARLRERIETIDAELHQKDNKGQRAELEKLTQDVKGLSAHINQLLVMHKETLKGKHTALLERVHRVAQTQANEAKIIALKQACDRLTHPVAKKLQYFLTYQTEASLRALKDEMQEGSYQVSKELTDAIWEASTLEPKITEGLVREVELPSIWELQQRMFHDTADKHHALSSKLEALTDQRVALTEDLDQQTAELLAVDREFQQKNYNKHAVSQPSIAGYIPRSLMKEITEKGLQGYVDQVTVLKKEIDRLQKRLKPVNEAIQEAENELAHCVVKPVLFTPEILQALIAKCNTKGWLLTKPHPVVIALEHFLNYRTPTLLTQLRVAMHEHADYAKDAKIKGLLDEANLYFPYIKHLEHPDRLSFFAQHRHHEEQAQKPHLTSRPSGSED